ncbi:Catabolic 3-dehydroquinase [Castellaniella defragrans]
MKSLRSGSKRHLIAVIDGPNMSNLGARNKRIYGPIKSMDDLSKYVDGVAETLGVSTEHFVSNYQGAILSSFTKARSGWRATSSIRQA